MNKSESALDFYKPDKIDDPPPSQEWEREAEKIARKHGLSLAVFDTGGVGRMYRVSIDDKSMYDSEAADPGVMNSIGLKALLRELEYPSE